jgi:hypothetical protein
MQFFIKARERGWICTEFFTKTFPVCDIFFLSFFFISSTHLSHWLKSKKYSQCFRKILVKNLSDRPCMGGSYIDSNCRFLEDHVSNQKIGNWSSTFPHLTFLVLEKTRLQTNSTTWFSNVECRIWLSPIWPWSMPPLEIHPLILSLSTNLVPNISCCQSISCTNIRLPTAGAPFNDENNKWHPCRCSQSRFRK